MIYEEILLYHFEDELKKYEKSKKENKSFIQHIINSENNNIVI